MIYICAENLRIKMQEVGTEDLVTKVSWPIWNQKFGTRVERFASNLGGAKYNTAGS